MSCCPAPDPARRSSAAAPRYAAGDGDLSERIALPGGRVRIGTDAPVLPVDGEGPSRPVRLPPFRIDACAVTNDRFARFVAATGHRTDAERFGWSYVFAGLLDDPEAHAPHPDLPWWRRVEGALWSRPEGRGSDVEARMDHPVTHVSWRDANAFASWAGGMLPSEGQWEHAALGGLEGARYPWGDAEPDDTGFLPCNIWQGAFPSRNTGADGHVGTAPVRSFAPNGFGLYNMVGNTWEWTRDAFRVRSLSRQAKAINADAARAGAKVIKGGSFLCHRSYCFRYRIAARSSNTADSTLSHTGFRLVYPL